MTSQVYINYKLNSFPFLFHIYFFIFLVFKLLIISIEDFIDYYYVYRESYKIVYLREELFAFIFIIQNWYYDRKSCNGNDLNKLSSNQSNEINKLLSSDQLDDVSCLK